MQPTIPRRGSMQYWPRVRAQRSYPSLSAPRSLKQLPAGLYGFAGYKVGMTHVMAIDTNKHSQTKGEEVSIPVTVLECPPLRVIGVRTYVQRAYGIHPAKDVVVVNDKHITRILSNKKTPPSDFSSISLSGIATVSVLVATQPHLSGVHKKTPEVFEMLLGGTNEEKLNFAKEHAGRELLLQNTFKEGDLVDTHAVSKGKGLQGPVRRFGVSLRSHKSEKTKRGPGSLGPWSGQAHIMYRVAHAGQMGYHNRTEYNKQILKISNNPEEVKLKGDFIQYGKVRSSFMLIKGSVTGSRKRLVLFTKPTRASRAVALPTIQTISLESKQG